MTENNKWQDRETSILKETAQEPWTSNPCWNHPAFVHEKRLHLSYVWYIHSIGDKKIVNNIDYTISNDFGKIWRTS